MKKLIFILLLLPSICFSQGGGGVTNWVVTPGLPGTGYNLPGKSYLTHSDGSRHILITKDSCIILFGQLSTSNTWTGSLNAFATIRSSDVVSAPALAGNGSGNIVPASTTGGGNVVLNTSPNLTTPRIAGGANHVFGSFGILVGNQTVTANRVQPYQDKDGTFAYLDDISGSTDNQLSKTANYTILSTDFVVGKAPVIDLEVDATSGNVTITMLSAASWQGKTIYITKIDASANTVTVNTVSGGNTLISQWQSRTFKSNGTIISNR